MRKSTLFISAALTTFILAVLFGVASAYQNIVKSGDMTAQPTTDVSMVNQPIVVVPPTQVLSTQITPEAAADIAGKVLGRTDMYSVEFAQFEGAEAYLVTFSSGDLVYLSLDGQILSISKLPVTIITQRRTGGGGGGGGGSAGDGGDEHEEHEDDDHD
jgi:hypothetical protein